jgi:hypothetical protein
MTQITLLSCSIQAQQNRKHKNKLGKVARHVNVNPETTAQEKH